MKNNYRQKQKQGRTVIVMHDNVDQAIKKLRRVVKQNKIMESYYQHRYFVKPSVKNAKKRSFAKFKAKCWQQAQDKKLTEF